MLRRFISKQPKAVFIHLISQFHHIWHKCQSVPLPEALHQFMHRMLGDLIVLSDCLILMTMDKGHCLHRQSWNTRSQPKPQGNWTLKNVCYKTNLDVCRIPGHATKTSAGFFRYTWASIYRPQPRFLTNQPRYSAQILICKPMFCVR